MRPLAQFNKIDVVFATPSATHNVAMEYARSMIETNWLLWSQKVTTASMQRGGDCFVQKVRNKLVGDFLEQFPDCENFFFLDDDIGWPAQKVLEFVRRPDDIVGGIYPKKSDQVDFPVEFAFDEQNGMINEQNGMAEAWVIPTGFMRIKRHVLEKMRDKFGMFKDFDVNENNEGIIKEFPNIFWCGPQESADNLFWGEDYTFCRRAREMGFSMWVDPDIEFTHRGTKKWQRSMKNHMSIIREKAAAMKPLDAAE